MAAAPPVDSARAPDEPSRLGKFIQTYHSFLSTFVIGAAGLIATSVWQYKQSEITRRQAESQQAIAATQAENSWRIERAEILSKNLQVLASPGEATVEQRYGVLLSLTRGNILDGDLAVSYALELGKDNAEYMQSVLSNVPALSFPRLASAFELTCAQRFGVTREVPICRNDALADRSAAIADLVADETEQALKHRKPGPVELLADAREVQAAPGRFSFLFASYLDRTYERRLWSQIDQFEALSEGARLVAALVLAPTRPGEPVAMSEAAQLERFHAERSKWLLEYLLGPGCDSQCKSRLLDVMLSQGATSEDHFDATMRSLLARPRAEIAPVLSRLHARLLGCQLDASVANALRDSVLVPALSAESQVPHPDDARLADLLGLLALLPEPPARVLEAQSARVAWQAALRRARDIDAERFDRGFTAPRAGAALTRRTPPAALSKAMFCSAAETIVADADLGED